MPLSKIVANSITDDTITTDQIADTSVHGRRNLLINGAYQIFQRASSATAATSTYTTADRWIPFESTDGAMTTEQSSDHPFSGFSLKAQVTTADSSIGAAQFCYIFQKIEAQNLQHLLYGTSSAKPLTLSFYVKSNKTGTYTINLHKGDNTAYNYVQEYTISSANTWEKKTITISPTAGSTSLITSSAGAINNDTGAGLELGFGLAWGSDFNTTANTWVAANDYSTTNQVNWMDSTSNNFYLTEVQLEVGEVSNPVFEHRSFSEELNSCLRYYHTSNIGNPDGSLSGAATGIAFDANEVSVCYEFPVPMRATPAITLYDNAGNSARVHRMRSGDHSNATSASLINKTGFANFASTGMAVNAGYLGGVEADAEL